MNKSDETREVIAIITPVFDDWVSFQKLAGKINDHMEEAGSSAILIVVDDGSTEPQPDFEAFPSQPGAIRRVEILHLARNMGHQRAIAIGLSYAEETCHPNAAIVMDADGEDDPATLPELIEEFHRTRRIVFAGRADRHETLLFKAFYQLYRVLFFFLTGRQITFGNYCVIPRALLGRVVFLPEIWNHFAAGIMRSGLPQTTLQLPRGTRYAGRSKMDFVGLVLHGLSAISVYTDILAVRLILFTTGVIVSSIAGSIMLLYIRFFTALAIPGWATSVAFGIGIILFQALIFLSLISFLVLNSRSAQLFIPVKHYSDFLLAKEIVYEQS